MIGNGFIVVAERCIYMLVCECVYLIAYCVFFSVYVELFETAT